MSDLITRAEAIEALRAAADLLESLPDDFHNWWYADVQAYNLTADEMATAARLPGTWTKGVAGENDSMFELSQGIVELHANRDQVCTAVPTGRTTTVKKLVTPPVYEEVEVPEMEWDCPPLLAGEPS